jgi:hypothetical protein
VAALTRPQLLAFFQGFRACFGGDVSARAPTAPPARPRARARAQKREPFTNRLQNHFFPSSVVILQSCAAARRRAVALTPGRATDIAVELLTACTGAARFARQRC